LYHLRSISSTLKAIVAIMSACHIDNFVLIRVNKTWSAIHKYVCFAIYILKNLRSLRKAYISVEEV
jgi:hypothetical protein